MARRRMFSGDITETDAFLDMPDAAQSLYFHLNMYADDDGLLGDCKRITRFCGKNENDLKVLIERGFVIQFASEVIVIKHWLMHNTLKNDRYHSTRYIDEKKLLFIKENRSYSLDSNKGVPILSEEKETNKKPEPTWNQSGTNLEPEHNITEQNVVLTESLNESKTLSREDFIKKVIDLWNRKSPIDVNQEEALKICSDLLNKKDRTATEEIYIGIIKYLSDQDKLVKVAQTKWVEDPD